MRAAKTRRRIESPIPSRVPGWTPPDLRRLVILIELDSGRPIVRTLALHRSDRIDCYQARVKGRIWKPRIGWSRVLAGIRKALPRIEGAE